MITGGLDSGVVPPSVVRKSRLKAKAKVLIQLQSMQAKTLSIDQMLHSLQELSDHRCQREGEELGIIKVPQMRQCSRNNSPLCCEHEDITKVLLFRLIHQSYI